MAGYGKVKYRILFEVEVDLDAWVKARQPSNKSETNVKANVQHETELACQDEAFIGLVSDHFQAHGGAVRILAPTRPAYTD